MELLVLGQTVVLLGMSSQSNSLKFETARAKENRHGHKIELGQFLHASKLFSDEFSARVRHHPASISVTFSRNIAFVVKTQRVLYVNLNLLYYKSACLCLHRQKQL